MHRRRCLGRSEFGVPCAFGAISPTPLPAAPTGNLPGNGAVGFSLRVGPLGPPCQKQGHLNAKKAPEIRDLPEIGGLREYRCAVGVEPTFPCAG